MANYLHLVFRSLVPYDEDEFTTAWEMLAIYGSQSPLIRLVKGMQA